MQRRYVGGRGVGTRLAHEHVPFDAGPLGPENRPAFATGPMQASTMSFTGRMNRAGVSPLTDGLLSSNAGGFMSRPVTATGYGAVEIAGRSDELWPSTSPTTAERPSSRPDHERVRTLAYFHSEFCREIRESLT
jgi:hypothetical protein